MWEKQEFHILDFSLTMHIGRVFGTKKKKDCVIIYRYLLLYITSISAGKTYFYSLLL